MYRSIFLLIKEGYRRPPNLRDKLIRTRIPDPPRLRPKRLIPGMKPCGLNCPTCPYIEPGTVIQSSNTSKKIEINGTFNCKTRNVVYCITCEQCKLQYIGQTTRSLDERVREHIGSIRNLHTNQPTGELRGMNRKKGLYLMVNCNSVC